jgi:toxin-antitoxin system PIN domain toxin
MQKSTSSFLFPDINVWLALSYEAHSHHIVARSWLRTAERARLFFCRHTQLGLLRLLSAEAVMAEDAMNQADAWKACDRWLEDDRVEFIEEPPDLEPIFRSMSQLQRPAPKDWADSYLASFASASQLTIVTFDRALHAKARSGLLLRT